MQQVVVEGISYNAKLPSTGRDLLLVGAPGLTKSLAAALVQVQFDQSKLLINKTNKNKNHQEDPAIASLRKHCCFTSKIRQRHVHTMEDLQQLDYHNKEEWNEKARIDHIAFVISTNEQQKAANRDLLEEAREVLSDDYLILQRVTIVQVQEGTSSNDRRPKSMMRTTATTSNTTIPIFPLQLDSPISHLTVARMLWQRTKLGTWEATPILPHVHPTIFGTYEATGTALP